MRDYPNHGAPEVVWVWGSAARTQQHRERGRSELHAPVAPPHLQDPAAPAADLNLDARVRQNAHEGRLVISADVADQVKRVMRPGEEQATPMRPSRRVRVANDTTLHHSGWAKLEPRAAGRFAAQLLSAALQFGTACRWQFGPGCFLSAAGPSLLMFAVDSHAVCCWQRPIVLFVGG